MKKTRDGRCERTPAAVPSESRPKLDRRRYLESLTSQFQYRFKGLGPETASPEPPAAGSAFEADLFANGVYVYDHELELTRALREAEGHEDWLNRRYDAANGSFMGRLSAGGGRRYAAAKEESAEKDLMELLTRLGQEMGWRKFFSGKVPTSWYLWHGPHSDFKEAGRLGIQLSDVLIDAGVSHRHPLVVEQAATNQRLNQRQLDICRQSGLGPGRWRAIDSAQRHLAARSEPVEAGSAQPGEIPADSDSDFSQPELAAPTADPQAGGEAAQPEPGGGREEDLTRLNAARQADLEARDKSRQDDLEARNRKRQAELEARRRRERGSRLIRNITNNQDDSTFGLF